ncbi:MAG TPA: patatin-like phospholipase family protein [Ktedonobacteraceae bacterium]|nr:patatin-like phospholipase family protein [Ktedonobacteraceae bacterium]
MDNENKPAYIAFQGGGALGMAHLGAWRVLSRYFRIKGTAGTSAGAIVAALCAATYDPAHAITIFQDLNWREYVKPSAKDIVDLIWKRRGWTDGELFYQKMKKLLVKPFLENQHRVSFETLNNETGLYLGIIACNLNNNTATPVIFDINHESDTEVAFAVRASISIPGIFAPVLRRDRGQVLVDGGLLLNLPLGPLLSLSQKDHAILIGVKFENTNLYLDDPNMLDTLKRSLGVAISPGALTPPQVLESQDYIDVVIDVSGFDSLDFNLSQRRKEELLHLGAEAASKALSEYEYRMQGHQKRERLAFSLQNSNEQDVKGIYISYSWRRTHENSLVNYICRSLYDEGFTPLGDAKDQAETKEERLKFIMSSCGGVIAFVSDRGMGSPSKYIINEIKMARALGLPCLVIAESSVKLEEDLLNESVIYVPIEHFENYASAISLLEKAVEDFKEEWKAPPQVPYIFLATGFDDSDEQKNRQIVQLIQETTAIPCVVGDEIQGSQVVQQVISKQISQAHLVIADITGDTPTSWNVNTCIEAGIARGTNRELNLICRKSSSRTGPPFMFRDRQLHFYNDEEHLLKIVYDLMRPLRRWVFKPDMDTN